MKKLKEIISGEKEFLKIKINKLENENKIMLDKLIILGNNKNINIDNEINNNNQIISKNSSMSNYNELKYLINMESKIYLENDNKIIDNNNIDNNIQSNKNKNKTELNIITPKILTIKNTKDIIQEIYIKKYIYGQKCYENKIPREILEQYLYAYLNQKYGLKNLILEWASSIINSIKMDSSEYCDIKLFGKIYLNYQNII